MERHTILEPQKTLEQLAREASHYAAQLEAMAPAMRALGDIEILVDYEELAARFGFSATPTTALFNAVRA